MAHDNASTGTPAAALHRYLDLSTMHLTEQEMAAVSSNVDDLPRGIKHEYGGWLHVPRETFETVDTPQAREQYPNVFAALDLALSLGEDVWWINFDMDVDALPNLPTFQW